jgi:hypothetical protein
MSLIEQSGELLEIPTINRRLLHKLHIIILNNRQSTSRTTMRTDRLLRRGIDRLEARIGARQGRRVIESMNSIIGKSRGRRRRINDRGRGRRRQKMRLMVMMSMMMWMNHVMSRLHIELVVSRRRRREESRRLWL